MQDRFIPVIKKYECDVSKVCCMESFKREQVFTCLLWSYIINSVCIIIFTT